jgi:hypothetical protein
MLAVQKRATELGLRLWRNNIGSYKLPNGAWLTYGLQNPGGSDLIGFTRKTITQDMVGQQIAVFTAVEVKTKTGTTSDAQSQFINFVVGMGGIAGVCRSREELDGLVSMHQHPLHDGS